MSLSYTIDLRSDTVTQPTAAMREAMRTAEVGDDVYGEDPSINRLEARAAEVFAREAALFVPTGTMGNQIAIHLHTRPGQEIVCEQRAHVYDYEMGMPGAFSGCLVRPVAAFDGRLNWQLISAHLHLAQHVHQARTGLIVVENTHNMAGGVVLPLETGDEICREAHELGLPVHLDGARIFNAAAALNVDVARLTRDFDSVMFCLSKGLGAPVGSLLAAGAEWIRRARVVRKMLGGGMRQAGMLAAAGLLALEDGPAQLAADHAHARLLAEGLARLPGIQIDPRRVKTNIVIFQVAASGQNAATLASRLAQLGVLCGVVGPDALRWVTHRDVSRQQCEQALQILAEVLVSAKSAGKG